MKKFKIDLLFLVWVIVGIIAVYILFTDYILAEVPVKYNGKMCKMEIITSEGLNNRNAKTLIEKQVFEFCKNKYIYDINIAVDKGKYIYVIMYNDMVE